MDADDNDGDTDAALTSLVRQLESFSEKRTGASRGGKGSGGHHVNRILASREYMMRPGCFSDDKIEM